MKLWDFVDEFYLKKKRKKERTNYVTIKIANFNWVRACVYSFLFCSFLFNFFFVFVFVVVVVNCIFFQNNKTFIRIVSLLFMLHKKCKKKNKIKKK